MEEGQATPRSLPDSDEVTPQTPRTPATIEKDFAIPPSPPGDINPKVQQQFKKFWEIKERGKDMNALIKNRKQFKNPAIYETLIEKFGLDEIGTNFTKGVFDPHAFNEDSYYEELAAQQKKAMDAQEARANKKAATAKDVIKHHVEERKSRFEKAKK